MALPSNPKILVYLVDDHRMVRAGLSTIFEDYPQVQVVGEAAEAGTALEEIASLRPHVALVDLRLPGRDGCSLCRDLKSRAEPPRVLILTSFGETVDMVSAISAGADGYLLKDCEDDTLVAAITTVARGGTVWPPTARRSLLDKPGKKANPMEALSPKERRVLSLIAEGKTNKEIGAAFNVSEKTVRNQITSLMRKLSIERRAQAAALYVRCSGTT